jgi:exonuclease SbcC
MKILKLQLKNINSLVGESVIDFEKEFSKTLFLITGATGSGKTTILDAICCALYNKTPRLANATEQLLSKKSAEGSISLEYEVDGEVYRNNWSLYRAHKKLDGKIQGKKFSLAQKNSAGEFEILVDKAIDVPKKVQEITGLDFAQFQKSMLLSQGNFDAFLKASGGERATLLEKMTGSEIYAKIGKKIYEVHATKQKKLEELNLKLQTITLLDPELLLEKEQELLRVKKRLKELSTQSELKQKKLNTLEKKESIAQEIQSYTEKIESLKEDSLRLVDSLQNAKEIFEDCKKKSEIFSQEYTRESQQIQKVLLLDSACESDKKNIAKLKQEIERAEGESVAFESEKKELIQEQKKMQQANESAKCYLQEHQEDSTLLENFPILKHQLQEYAKLTMHQSTLKRKHEVLQESIQTLKETLGKNEIQLEQFLEEATYLEAKLLVNSFESARAALKTGDACPLCGSQEHPYLKNGVEIEDSITQKVAALQKTIKKMQQEQESHKTKLTQSQTQLEGIDAESIKIKEDFELLEKTLGDAMDLYNFSLNEEITVVIKALEKRYKEYKKQQELVQLFEKEYSKKASSIDILDAKIATLSKEKMGLTKQKDTQSVALEQQLAKRYDLFGHKDTQEVKEQLEREKHRVEKALKSAEKQLHSYETQQAQLESSSLAFEKLLVEKKEAFTKLGTLDSLDIASLKQELQELNKERDSLNKGEGSLSQLLEQNSQKQQQVQEYQKEIEREQKIIQPYAILNSLIGSAQGDNFKRFAQNLTLGYLLSLANQHLNTLNPRYYLVKNEHKDLELLIEDRYMANELRDVKTLSGGESFLVSLALALGLSDMVSSKVSIDSLFLDEGFGTLDPETLNDALVTLNKLQESGKMIGIISHVETLKEEIPRQIRIEKVSNGRGLVRIV